MVRRSTPNNSVSSRTRRGEGPCRMAATSTTTAPRIDLPTEKPHRRRGGPLAATVPITAETQAVAVGFRQVLTSAAWLARVIGTVQSPAARSNPALRIVAARSWSTVKRKSQKLAVAKQTMIHGGVLRRMLVTPYGVHPSETSIKRSGSSRGFFSKTSASSPKNRPETLPDLAHAHWSDLYDGRWYSQPRLQPVAASLDDLFRRVSFSFTQPDSENSIELHRLSDGLQSLFYLALVAAMFSVEQSFLMDDADNRGFCLDNVTPPDLTVFAIEEPENHLAPHYLARILSLFEQISRQRAGQVVLSSHSASILKRIDPRAVRHFRLIPTTQACCVKPIALPEPDDAAFKYVKEAVQAYPELYFSRFVILCEGDSEEVILPRVARAQRVAIDAGFISVVPLGGRHVNHFWRLLMGLDIPHATLLDFDRERIHGAWGRIKYALKQLLANGAPRDELLRCRLKSGATGTLSEPQLESMDDRAR